MPDWPHAPLHRLDEAGTYMVTAATYRKQPFFAGAERLAVLEDRLLYLALQYEWALQAWAVFPNHYHLIALSPSQPRSLSRLTQHLHSVTACGVNAQDHTAGRQVWFDYWETRLTFQSSYLARLNYVHQNAVHHGIVGDASSYPWCSARWFEQTADAAFRRVVGSCRIDRVKVRDDY